MKTIGIFPLGKLGGSTLSHLIHLVPHDKVTLICRHPENVPAEYTQSGVRVRKASYEASPDELEAAFAGIDVLFLISYPSHVHDYRVKVQLPAVDAARRAGVQHLLYSSLAYAGPADSLQSRAVVMHAHLDTEKYLRKLASEAAAAAADDVAQSPPFRFTSIREGLYAESVPIYTAFYNPSKDASSVIRIPHDGSGPGVTWVKTDELGEGTARLVAAAAVGPEAARGNRALSAASRYLEQTDTVLLTGPRAWTLAETVDAVFNTEAKLQQRSGKAVRIQEVSVDEYVALPAVQAVFAEKATGAGSDPGRDNARTWATAWDAIRHGETAVVTAALADILGRPPAAAF